MIFWIIFLVVGLLCWVTVLASGDDRIYNEYGLVPLVGGSLLLVILLVVKFA